LAERLSTKADLQFTKAYGAIEHAGWPVLDRSKLVESRLHAASPNFFATPAPSHD